MKHLLAADDLTREEVVLILDLTGYFKIHSPRNSFTDRLRDQILGTLFFEPSTRTRWSTEAAMLRLGGQILSFECAKESSSDRKGESLQDTFKTVSQFVDILAVRHPIERSVINAASYSDVPVINGGDGANEHPTQALLDLFTILEQFPHPNELSILFTGDIACSRTIRSLVKLLAPYKPRIIVGCEETTVLAEINPWGSTDYVYRDDIYSQLPKIDILYMTRHQTERTNKERERSTFVLTHPLAQTMKKNAIIMHPLPRTEELLPEVDKNGRAVYFEQVKNGMFVRMALLCYLLGKC